MISLFKLLLKEGFVILLSQLEKQHLNLLVGILLRILMLVYRYGVKIVLLVAI